MFIYKVNRTFCYDCIIVIFDSLKVLYIYNNVYIHCKYGSGCGSVVKVHPVPEVKCVIFREYTGITH